MWGKAPASHWSRPVDLRLFRSRRQRAKAGGQFRIENCPNPQPLAPFFGGTADSHEAMGDLFGIMAFRGEVGRGLGKSRRSLQATTLKREG
jgi:hypothetical protein